MDGGYNYIASHSSHSGGGNGIQPMTIQHIAAISPSHSCQPSRYAAGPYYGSSRSEHVYTMDQARFKEVPQYAQPEDSDPSRFYQVQEKDGSWTRRNRRTIDNYLTCRWYQRVDGTWFAIRLDDWAWYGSWLPRIIRKMADFIARQFLREAWF